MAREPATVVLYRIASASQEVAAVRCYEAQEEWELHKDEQKSICVCDRGPGVDEENCGISARRNCNDAL